MSCDILSMERAMVAGWEDPRSRRREAYLQLSFLSFVRFAPIGGPFKGPIGAIGGWVPEGSLAGFLWVGFWGLGGPWGL